MYYEAGNPFDRSCARNWRQALCASRAAARELLAAAAAAMEEEAALPPGCSARAPPRGLRDVLSCEQALTPAAESTYAEHPAFAARPTGVHRQRSSAASSETELTERSPWRKAVLELGADASPPRTSLDFDRASSSSALAAADGRVNRSSEGRPPLLAQSVSQSDGDHSDVDSFLGSSKPLLVCARERSASIDGDSHRLVRPRRSAKLTAAEAVARASRTDEVSVDESWDELEHEPGLSPTKAQSHLIGSGGKRSDYTELAG